MTADWFEASPRPGRQSWALRLARWRFRSQARIDFYVNMAFALERGLMVREALDSLLRMERDLPGGPFGRPLALIIPHWLALTARGETFSRAVDSWVGPHEAISFAAAARVGISAEQLRNLAGDTARLARLGRVVGKAAAPFLMTAIIIWGCFAAAHFYMFPVFEAEAQRGGGGDIVWRGMAGWLHATSATMTFHGGPVALVMGLAGLPATVLLARRWTGRIRVLADRFLPGFGIYRQLTGITWLLAMAALLEAGRTPAAALETLRAAASPYLRERIDAALSRPDLALGDALLAAGLGWPDIRVIHRIRLCLSGSAPAVEFRALAAFEFTRMEERLAVVAELIAAVGYGFFTAFILAVIFAQNDIAISLQ